MNLLDYSLFVRLQDQNRVIKTLQRLSNIIGIIFLFIALPLSFFLLLSGIDGHEIIIYVFLSLEVLAILSYIFIMVLHAVKLQKFRREGRADDDVAEGAFFVVNNRLDEYIARRNKLALRFGIAGGCVIVIMAILLVIFSNETYVVLGIIITLSAAALIALALTPLIMILLAQYRLSTRCVGEFEIIEEYLEKQEYSEAAMK